MPSQHNLAFLYMNGKGVKQDYAEAYMWALLAADSGNDTLKRSLDYRVSPETKQKARQMAEQMKLRMKLMSETASKKG